MSIKKMIDSALNENLVGFETHFNETVNSKLGVILPEIRKAVVAEMFDLQEKEMEDDEDDDDENDKQDKDKNGEDDGDKDDEELEEGYGTARDRISHALNNPHQYHTSYEVWHDNKRTHKGAMTRKAAAMHAATGSVVAKVHTHKQTGKRVVSKQWVHRENS